MELGTILHHKYFNGVADKDFGDKYQSLALEHFRNFGMFGTGMMKMITSFEDGVVHYDFSNTDKLVEFGSKNKLQIHYNTVITGRIIDFPDWYQDFTKDNKLQFLEEHVRKIVSRYKGKVDYFKLVNEPIKESNNDYLKTGLSKIELIKMIFDWAVDEYPDGKYMLNEYGVIIRDEIRKPFIELVEKLVKIGTRIDIIGLQGHSGYFPIPFQIPPKEVLLNALVEVDKKIQLPIHITEFDLSYRNHIRDPYPGSEVDPKLGFSSHTSWYQYQQTAYREYVDICRSSGVVDKIFFWMFADDTSLTWERVGCGLLDKYLNPKLFLLGSLVTS